MTPEQTAAAIWIAKVAIAGVLFLSLVALAERRRKG